MKIKELIFHPKSKYIVITFVTSAIGFLKSFILLKLFNLDKLSLLTLLQTIITTISILQFGVITGGYRLYSYKRENILKGINSAVFVFFIFLSAILFLIGALGYLFYDIEVSFYLSMIFIFVAITSLYSNWVICKLLATKNVTVVNNSQLLSNIISFLLALSAYWLGFEIVIFSVILQPLLIIGVAYTKVPKLIPIYNFHVFKKYIHKILSIGFIPYLTSAMMLLNSQLGRWIITFTLGTLILGRIYLVTLFVTFGNIFPNALGSLFFPSIIEKYEKKMTIDLNGTIKKYFQVLCIYLFLTALFTFTLLHVLVSMFFEKHIGSLNLIFAILPSLIFLHLCNPAITLFNAAKKFKYILTGSIAMVVSYCIIVVLYLIFCKPQLIGFFIIESISAFVFFIYNMFYFNKIIKL